MPKIPKKKSPFWYKDLDWSNVEFEGAVHPVSEPGFRDSGITPAQVHGVLSACFFELFVLQLIEDPSVDWRRLYEYALITHPTYERIVSRALESRVENAWQLKQESRRRLLTPTGRPSLRAEVIESLIGQYNAFGVGAKAVLNGDV